MHEPTYRQALQQTWHLVWHNKLLWILGVCSAFLGQWGLSDLIGQVNIISTSDYSGPLSLISNLQALVTLPINSVAAVFLTLWLVGIVLVIGAAVAFVAVVSRSALIAITAAWFQSKTHLSLTVAWHIGVKRFWTVLALIVVNKILQLAVVVSLGGVFWLANLDNLVHVVGLVVFSILALFIALMFEASAIYACGYTVVEQNHFLRAVRRGFHLFFRHILVSLETGLLLFFLNLLLVGAVVIGSFFIFIPSFLMWLVAGLSGVSILFNVGMILGLTLFVLLVIILGGFFNAFTTSAWTYLFMKMHHEGVVARLAHYAKRLISRG